MNWHNVYAMKKKKKKKCLTIFFRKLQGCNLECFKVMKFKDDFWSKKRLKICKKEI